MKLSFSGAFLFVLIFTKILLADSKAIRWTSSEDKNAEFYHVIEVLNQKTGFHLSASDFLLIEDRDLANNHFRMFVQTAAEIPLDQKSIRIWTNLKTNELIQVEALVESDKQLQIMVANSKNLSIMQNEQSAAKKQKQINKIVNQLIQAHQEDPRIRDLSIKQTWDDGRLIFIVVAKGKHGTHKIKILQDTLKVLDHSYVNFPNADQANTTPNTNDEFSVPALVFPIYEETAGLIKQSRVATQLKHLKKKTKLSASDSYASLLNRRYLSDKLDPILGLTPEGQADGFWAMSDIKSKAVALYENLPEVDNSFARGVILSGRYATINIHPDAIKELSGIRFTPQLSAVFKPSWQDVTDAGQPNVYEMLPGPSYLGRPLTYFEEAYARPARRLSDHNPVEYINDGFDEVQVYYAIDTLFGSLHEIGFTDPELSTRPFHAFLYDPDIGMRDNAYYTDDTINFTTYSPSGQNFARDNSTIWHELGHGIMDRLMGDHVRLADSGGLSEGMADFVASLVVEKVKKGQSFDGEQDFRIVNSMGFSLTNEEHDDGESYGGAMYDILIAARKKYGSLAGVTKVGDLTLESMRLCRNHPGITAEIWFNHMLFADELGHLPTRAPGELRELIMSALANRNFTLDGKGRAQFQITYNDKDVNFGNPGTRYSPVRLTLAADQKTNYSLQVSIVDGEQYKFAYPLTVKIRLRGGPLQGALHWDGEENEVLDYVLKSPQDLLTLNLGVSGKCDFVNRPDGSCSDYAYIQLWPAGAKSPVAKKRFYLRLTPR